MTSRRDLSAQAWGSVLRVQAALVPRLDQRLQTQCKLTLAWYDVLLELNASPGRRLRMSDLGERVVLSRTRVSRVVDEMQRAGLVIREANEEDRRSSYAAITPEGRRAFRQAAPRYLDAIEEEFASSLTVADLKALRDALERVLAATRG